MEIAFIKLQSCGNDFIIVDTFKNAIVATDQLPDMAAQICSRHFGVGAMGLVLILQGERHRLRMICYSPQGAECPADPMAARCVARYAFDAGLTGGESFSVETRDEAITLEILDAYNITIPGGPPQYWERKEAIRERSAESFTRTLRLADRELNYTPLRLRGAQAVFFPGGSPLELAAFGQAAEAQALFPKATNLIFARMISREELSLRIWETGRGELLASEASAGAAVVAAVLNGYGERQALTHLEGGNLFIDWSDDNLLYASGSAEYVFMGTYYYEEESIETP